MEEIKGKSIYQGRDYVTLVSFPFLCSLEGMLGLYPGAQRGTAKMTLPERSFLSPPSLGLLGIRATAATEVLA